ncbi:hypothetical protein UMM65_12045 [Aureibaculum sp. 2210JD6-5]|uniref:DUF7933 domain-containing protein n=1 Tax=Aureibaculum sp. 2210JD6-5 TaxID=3103957 RepID=UPI002AADF7AD|nr:hypothetical protein [Aureibaculum sp. 2210JD6-5]MDY7395980.1 hypothetical protein [Aureibaculum sp. 2210JD6-5]
MTNFKNKIGGLITVLLLLFTTQIFAQSVGDYRSIASGNWTTVSIWEYFDGTSWIAVTEYPGQTGGTGTNDVYIEGGFSVTLTSDLTEAINSVIIGDGIGTTDFLNIGATSRLNTQLISIETGGELDWIVNVDFTLPAGAAVVLNGGVIDEDTPCSAAQRLIIDTTIYSSCNGGAGATYSFNDLNTNGGSIIVNPSSNSPISVGATLNLFANPSGTGAADPSNTFAWTGTGPNGYTFSSSLEDPSITGLAVGTYIFTVTVTSSGITYTASTTVTVSNLSNSTRSYSERTAINIVGNFEAIGNTSMQCSGCAAGTQTNNPSANMVYVDIDGIAATQNSSSSLLAIPVGATVEWAGLYWGGMYNSSNSGITNPTGMSNDQVLLMEPGALNYTTINASQRNQETTTFSGWNTFMSFAEVTSIVQGAGSGNYFVADINLATGSSFTGPHGGWTLVVVYSEPTEQSRRINVWDGFQFFGFGATDSFNVTGILTPSLGTFETKVGYYGMDGEASSTGDFINLNAVALTDASNPANNVFNGTVSIFGANNPNRNPNITPYNWGYDLDIFDASGYVPNSATSVAVQLGSTSEGVWGGVFVISNEIVLPTISKSFSPAQVDLVGDVSTVSITIDNPSRGINMTGATLTDNLPPGMVIAPTPNASTSCGGTITAVAGSSTFTASGMSIPVGTSCTITFDVVTTEYGVFTNTLDNTNFSNDQGVDLNNSTTATLTVGDDTDGDGIIDYVDLDDDNDGITDTQEYCGTDPVTGGSTTANITIDIDLDQDENETTWTLLDPSLGTVASGGPYLNSDELISQSFIVSTSGNYTFNIFDSFGDGMARSGGSNSNGTASYQIVVDGTPVFTSSNLPNFGSSDSQSFSISIIPPNPFSCLSSDPNGDDDSDGIINYQDADYAAANSSTLNSNGVVSILDTDGDGIINSLDLDSDNDGIYDIIESGAINVSAVNDSDNNGIIDGITAANIGSNGVFNTVETSADSGNLNYTVTNTDGTDNRDFLDLDSDNDLCNDVDEAGFTDDNNDGILGPASITVDSNGLITSGSDGYTTPADGNGNTTYDFQEAGATPVITNQPADDPICFGENASFSVTATGLNLTYQWQVSTNGGSTFTNLSNGVVYSNVNGPILNLTTPPQTYHNYQYRVIITDSAFSCGTVTSDEVLLTIQAQPDAGTNGTLDLCAGDTATLAQLNAAITGEDAGGTWSPALAPGITSYTYTVAATAPCTGNDTSTVTVTYQAQPDAGTNGTLTVCEGTTPTDAELFAELGGTPDAGGTWTNVGLVYTYTVTATAPCTGNDTATVTVTEQAQPDAGTNGTLTVCEGTTPTDAELFAELGGTPDAGGTWTNVGLVYTYTVTATAPCTGNDTATVTVTEQAQPDAGTNGTLTVCEGTTPTDAELFAELGGTPDAGGTWTNSGLVYTYTVTATAPCTGNDTATVTVTEQAQPDAGTNGTLTVCEGTTPTDAELFAELGGTPDAGGTWTNSGLVYTYTVTATAPCTGNDTATVTVTEQAQPDAGTNGTLTVCEGTAPTDAELFAELGGTPDAGGTWSNVGLVYTYTVTATAPCTGNDTATVTVTEQAPIINISNGPTCSLDLLTYSVEVTVSSGTVTSTSGTVTNTSGNIWNITNISSGTNITLTAEDADTCTNTLDITAPNCNCPVVDAPTSGGNESYCAGESIPTLTASVGVGETVDWYDQPSGGTLLLSGNTSYTPSGPGTYYAETRIIVSSCTSATRTAIVLTENPLPVAPVSGGNQTECAAIPTQTLTATATAPGGSSVVWYDAATGGNIVANPILNAVGTITYYAGSTDNTTNCESASRTAVILTIQDCEADLSLRKTVDNSTPDVGDDITFTITLRNDGPSDATTIIVRDIIPGDFTYTHPNFVTSQGTVTFNAGTRALDWNLGAFVLPVGDSITLEYTVTVDVCGEFKNQAEITNSSVSDPDSTPNNGN